MFLGQCDPMRPSQKQELFNNTHKIRVMVQCVAQFLADVLQIKDEEVDPKTPFVEISRRELHYFLSLRGDGRFHQMESLLKMYDFVVRAEDLSSRIRVCALECLGKNMDVSVFTIEESYYGGDQLICEGAVKTTIDVGDLGHRLQNEVKAKAREWLDDLDRVLCDCSSIMRTDSATCDDKLVYVKEYLSFAIAQRLTLMSYESIVDDYLSSRSLEELLNEVYQDSKLYAGESKKRDALLVKMLLALALDPGGEQTRYLIINNVDDLIELTTNPPSELECKRDIIDLEQLSRAFVPELDIEVRVAMVEFWAHNTNRASSVAQIALKEILDWQPIEKVVKIHSILARDGNSTVCPDFMIPPMGFLYTPRCFACRQPERRKGLPEAVARAECLIRAVWELASRGMFIGGVIAADVVSPVALDSILMARMAATSITNERDVNKLGFNMFNFVQRLYDMEGDHVRMIDKASCSLSHFSCMELETVFDTNNHGLAFLCKMLTARTRDLMTYSPNQEYASFATDTLAILLPLIYHRRSRVGIPTCMRSNSFLDIMRTIPRVLQWHPTTGSLQLTLDDMRHGHQSCRAIFEELHEKGVMVTRTGSGTGKRKVVYTFDTIQLWKILTENAALSPLSD